MTDDSWKDISFSDYDVVYHVAGIAHSDIRKVSQETKDLYYKVNSELAIETAKKAKADGVKQFIFMSSAIVYGDSSKIGKEKVITKDTPAGPDNFYGDSKLCAEKGLLPLNDNNFKVVILRCPMVYGKGSNGNFPTLEKLALTLPAFPNVKNSRSMLYIGNLCEFVRLMIVNEESGTFWPANRETSNTSYVVKLLAQQNGKKILLISGFTWLLKILSVFTGLVNKAFGSLTYDGKLTEYKCEYRKYSLESSIEEMYRND